MNRELLLELHKDLTSRARSLMMEKNKDYGGPSVLGNLTFVQNLSQGQVSTEKGIIIRMGDKLARAWTLCDREPSVKGEPLDDVILDLINYAVLLKATRPQSTQDLSRLAEAAMQEGLNA